MARKHNLDKAADDFKNAIFAAEDGAIVTAGVLATRAMEYLAAEWKRAPAATRRHGLRADAVRGRGEGRDRAAQGASTEGGIAMAGITKADVLAAVEEIVVALAEYSGRVGCEVELVLQANGTVDLMGAAGGTADPQFERLATFEAFEDLWVCLRMATGVGA